MNGRDRNPEVPKMTAKHFRYIASIIHGLTTDDDGDSVTIGGVREDFANALSDTHPDFDRERFLDACEGD